MGSVDQNIAQIEQIFGRTFNNKLLCAEALQMAGENVFINVGQQECLVKKNKALESVGDAIIDAVLCKTWYESLDDRGNRSSVGEWDSLIRQRLASNDNLGRLGLAAGIDSCIIKDVSMFRPGKKMVARTVEAIIGAYYMDAGEDGINAARDVMTNLGLSLTVTSNDPPTP